MAVRVRRRAIFCGQAWLIASIYRLLHGFLMREEVEALLRNEEIGTFLIRFSERHAGLFAVRSLPSRVDRLY